tara:strand:+ start:944 stop:1531 length:588 start_codon:yes stop_codon:yes gene_type:complete
MTIQQISITKVKGNSANPRIIKDHKFKQLVQSIKDFPEMLEIRPIVVNNNMEVLGGNMRLKACQDAGLKKIHIIKAEDLTPEQQKEFTIKDNVSFGEWDWDVLANQWESDSLNTWGMDVWNAESDLFELDDDVETEKIKPLGGDDDFSTFEMVMLHADKIVLTKVLQQIKEEQAFDNSYEALAYLAKSYNYNKNK